MRAGNHRRRQVVLLTSLLLMTSLVSLAEKPFKASRSLYGVVLERHVMPGEEYRVLVVSEQPPRKTRVSMAGVPLTSRRRDIISRSYPFARLYHGRAPKQRGAHAIEIAVGNEIVARPRLVVVDRRSWRSRPVPQTGIWETRRSWSNDWERVFSAWVAYLFRPLPDQSNRGWHRLHNVVENRQRNFLHNRLGYLEDSVDNAGHIRAVADCGDTPYFLRAYFAWKFELPCYRSYAATSISAD